MTPLDFLKTGVKSYLRPSIINGVGLFALEDIRRGEYPFTKWEGETDYYSLTYEEYSQLPASVVSYILRSYSNNIEDKHSKLTFRLTKGCNFLLAEPLAFLNTAGKYGSIDATTGIALTDIEKGAEILSNYGRSSQIALI